MVSSDTRVPGYPGAGNEFGYNFSVHLHNMAGKHILLAIAVASCVLLPSTSAFNPMVVVYGRQGLKLRTNMDQQSRMFQQGPAVLRMSSEPPAEEGETVDISVEELRELAQQAGINVKFASEMQPTSSGGVPGARSFSTALLELTMAISWSPICELEYKRKEAN